MKRFPYNLFKFTLMVVSWLIQGVNPESSRYLPMFRLLIQKLEEISKDKGLKYCVLYIKDVRLALFNYLAGTPLSRVPGVRLTGDGLPVILGDLLPIIRSADAPVFLLRFLTTILCASRSLSLGTDPDLTSISEASRISELPSGLGRYCIAFWRDLGYNPRFKGCIPKGLLWRKFHLSVKVGPTKSDSNASWNSINDLFNLPKSLIDSIKTCGGPKLAEKMDLLLLNREILEEQGLLTPNDGVIRKLSSFPDKELKVRSVGILDYFSQSCLRGLHSYLYVLLKKIPQDMTFDQGNFKTFTKDWKVFYSIDLTAATDRFPIQLICMVLEGYLPSHYVAAWKDIMTGYPFKVTNTKMISYAVGNPMGAYSSWASFAVAHHYIMYYLCRLNGIDWKTSRYCLLGDDILIGDEVLGKAYQELILSIGVDYSKPKTYTSPHFCEFAKRLLYKGEEISPFPISALRGVSHSVAQMTNFFLETEVKGWKFIGGASAAVSLFSGMVQKLPSRVKAKREKLACLSVLITNVMRGSLEAGPAINSIGLVLGQPLPPVSNFVGTSVLENLAVEMYADSNPANYNPDAGKGKGRPCVGLGPFAEHLVMRLQCYLDDSDPVKASSCLELIYCIPVLQLYGNIEETYMKLTRKAITFKDWPIALKSMALPWDDRIFTMRSSHLISRGISKIIKGLEERIMLLGFSPPAELQRQTPDQII